MSQKTTKRVFTRKSKLFLVLASMILALSCKNPLGDESGGSGSGGAGGGGSGGGQTITNKDGRVFPAWYLTEQQQKQNFSMGPKILFDTMKRNKGGSMDMEYRIPAIIVAKNGNIIAIADKRYSHGGDIGTGNNKPIDVVYKFSKDGGKNWSEEKIIPPKTPNNATMIGIQNKGDALVFLHPDGDLICMAVSGGGYSSAGNAATPSRMVRSESKDNGITWSSWKEVGQELFNKIQLTHGKKQGFATSGRGLTLKDGTLTAGFSVNDTSSGVIAVYAYSKDKGQTWQYGGAIKQSGGTINEPKVIAELDDGKLLMSVRNAKQNGKANNKNPNPRMFAKFDASGSSMPTRLSDWNFRCGNVDAEGVVWTRKNEQDITRILHIQAGPNYRNGLRLYISTDEGTSFPTFFSILDSTEKEIDSACYSSLDVCGDGTVVTLAEEHSPNGQYYDIVFRRYNMFDITQGKEVYKTKWYKDIK